jgi:DNA-binding transcriptional LysR family regulator
MILSMREVNIAGLDLNLVPALEALLRRKNVTRAAADAGLSQPAMSRALARLRDIFGDELLVRTRQGYVLTPRAEAIVPALAAAVRDLRQVFEAPKFDPLAERRVVRLAASDTQTVLLVPGLAARLSVAAPGVDLRVESYAPGLPERAASGAIDLVFALDTTPLPPGVFSEVIGEDELALVMRNGHPAAAAAWTLADYGRFSHVGVALLGDGQSEIDAMLAAAGFSRRIAVATPHFVAALATVAATDFVTTVSAALARRFAGEFGLAVRRPPFERTRLRTTLVCSHVRARDPFLVWFRALVREVAREVFGR